MALIYHANHQVVSCVCGILISGKHDCEILLSQVKVEFVTGFQEDRENLAKFVLTRKNWRSIRISGQKMIRDIVFAGNVESKLMEIYLKNVHVICLSIETEKRSVKTVKKYGIGI